MLHRPGAERRSRTVRPAVLAVVFVAVSAMVAAATGAGTHADARSGAPGSADVSADRAAPAPGFGPTADPPAGGRTGPVKPGANRWRYRGELGRLGQDEQVVEAVASPPTGRAGRAPLTGRPRTVPDRTAVVVKIDNAEPARPQTGLREADIVYEELVEGGQTRFAAVYHSRDPSVVGPVRSARSTDLAIVGSYRRPIFGYSGSNEIFGRLISRGPLIDRGAERYRGYWRDPARPAPFNLYTSPQRLRRDLTATRIPDPQFHYRRPRAPLHDAAVPASVIRLRFDASRGTPIAFRWDERKGAWLRSQAGSAHRDARGRRVAPENVIVQIVRYPDTGLTDRFGEVLYEGVAVGSGRALVFSGGAVVQATWTRPTLRSVTTYTDDQGAPIALAPGQTWVALVPRGSVTFDSPRCAGLVATIVGTGGDDVLAGTAGPDVIAAGGGDDRVLARDGDDVVCGDGGNDRLVGGAGDDRLYGGAGDDRLRGGSGVDTIVGGPGRDRPGNGVG